MNLPNAHLAIVDRKKIVDYLLNPAHPDNGGKAKFFLGHGFTAEQWQDFAEALRRLAGSFPVIERVESPHGIKYIVLGRIVNCIRQQSKRPHGIDCGYRKRQAAIGYSLSRRGEEEMIKERDRVVLTKAVAEEGLEPGDVGTVVHLYGDGKAYEVEFVALDGHTVAVATVEASDVRPVMASEIPHARELVAA